ncbi:myelin-associated glycoprotein isoform X1 [Pangasianodon hypophthalmus]|uniref:myelin-associated glycoprotein isoform X1 n=1 Tax=Pangasianodon hypophthalmus TaxID=310915 RepID=UPI002307DDC4|nr:myelin-associated glycoprotein isoform X1 [Pangasianodon hypophthalmus]XP_053083746.1 myelin-associated glycoprotein isoform X1 [Pangasianodon hypophthalmus]
MDRFGILKLFISVSLLGGVCRCWEVRLQRSVTAIKGSCVFVPCSTDSYSKVIWYKYKRVGYPVVYSQDTSTILDEFRGRTSVPGNAQAGNCTLKIDNVRQQDSEVDLYVWIWKHNGNDKGFYDQTIKIKVLEPVDPQMSVDKTQTKGKAFTATCKFRYSCPSPPPQIAWMGLQSISNVLTHTQDGEGLWVTEATAQFKVTHQDQATHLSCKIVHSGQSLSSNSVSLNILYAPTDLKVDYIGSSTVVEGSKISLRCTSKGNPAPIQYEWLVTQNNTTIRHTGSPVVLQNIRRRTSVSCIATNSVGKGESKQLSLDVHHAPTDVKVVYTGSSTIVEGNKISLRCTSASRPAPTLYEWLVTQNNTTIHHKGSTVVLQDVKRDTSVSCIATNSIGQGESKQLSLNVHYSPSILPGSFCSMQKGTLKCVCQAEAKPSAVISWTIDGSSVLFPLFNTTTQANGSMTESELTGPQGHNVTCTARNSEGTAFTQISVHSEGDASAVPVSVVAGVAGVCLVLGLAVAAIMIWKKRRHVEPSGDLSTGQNVKPDKICHDYHLESDEDLYVNAVHGHQAYDDQDKESCIYENYGKTS